MIPSSPSRDAAVVVVGGGPAGGFTALELAQAGWDVVLIERRPPTWKIGETLPAEAIAHLRRLGFYDRFAAQGHLPSHGFVSVWGSEVPVEKDSIFNPYGHGWQLDRVRFEAELLEAVSTAGCEVEIGVELVAVRREERGWVVTTSSRAIRTPWLVDCTGRAAAIAGGFGDFERLDDLVSVFAIAESPRATDRDARLYVESHPDGWCYSALMPTGLRIVAYQTDRDLVPEGPARAWLQDRLATGSVIGRLLAEHAYELGEPRLTPAHSGRYARCGGAGWAAVGDAAMTFDPLSGQGTAKSLDSSHQVVRAILEGDDYQAYCDRLWSNFVRDRRDNYLAERRWPDNPFWKRRHM